MTTENADRREVEGRLVDTEGRIARARQRLSLLRGRDAAFELLGIGSAYASLAVDAQVLGRSPEVVREAWRMSAQMRWSIFELVGQGEVIPDDYFTWLVYQDAFVAYAGGVSDLAERMLAEVRARGKAADDVHKFDRLFGRALAELVLGDADDAALRAFEAYLVKPADRHFIGYANGIQAIRASDGSAFAKALAEIAAGHKPLAARGVFRLTPSQHLCVWGIGLARYARHRGLRFEFDHPFLPSPLIAD